MSNTKNLIDAIDSGKSTEIEAAFSEVFATKVSTAIDNFRMEIANNIFESDNFISKDSLLEYNANGMDMHDGPPAVGHKISRENEHGKKQSGVITKVTPDKVHVKYKGAKHEVEHDHDDLNDLPAKHKHHRFATYHSDDGIKTAK